MSENVTDIQVGDIWQYYETDYFLVVERKRDLVTLYDIRKDTLHPDYETRYFSQTGAGDGYFWKLISRQKRSK